MKKRCRILIVIVLVTAMLCLSATSVFAAELDEYQNLYRMHSPIIDSYAANYYSSLINYFGYNSQDTCAYVALGMLLTYYDSFKHDNFVPDNLIVKSEEGESGYPLLYGSPGNLYEKTLVTNYANQNKTYTQFINDHKNQSLHAYLISLGMGSSLNFYNSSNLRTGGTESLGITSSQLLSLLIHYLYSVRGFTIRQVTIITKFVEDGHSADSIRSEMISKITAGVPVLYFGYKYSSNSGNENIIAGGIGHAMIAYDYDASNGNIYVHKGLNFEESSDALESTLSNSGYTTYGGIIWLEINESLLPHVCCDNYSENNSYVCGCQFYNCDK